jgi:CBS domain containing-hemolysin-like protein
MPTPFPISGIATRIIAVAVLLAVSALLAAADSALGMPEEEDEDRTPPTTAVRILASLATIALGLVGGAAWFIAVVALHIVVGEVAPRALARTYPDATRRIALPPVRIAGRVLAPVVIAVNAVAAALTRPLGVRGSLSERAPAHSPDELRTLVEQSHAQGEIAESDRAMLAGVFDFMQKRAHDVMRPRTEVVALDIDSTEDEVWRVLRTERYSRYPVYRETLDDVVGVFLAKDLWLRESNEPFSLAALVREALYVPDSRPADRVLDDLRRTRAYMAVVLDEYGGTAGIISIEDLVEEVMGDIADEYDLASRTALEMNGVLELAGTLSLIDARSDHGLDIPEGDWTTLGGFVFAQLGRLPKVGDKVHIPGATLEVVAMDGRRVAALRVLREEAPEAAKPVASSARG